MFLMIFFVKTPFSFSAATKWTPNSTLIKPDGVLLGGIFFFFTADLILSVNLVLNVSKIQGESLHDFQTLETPCFVFLPIPDLSVHPSAGGPEGSCRILVGAEHQARVLAG